MEAFKSILSITFILVFVYLLLKNATNTSSVLQSISALYTNSVSTLQGNGNGQASFGS